MMYVCEYVREIMIVWMNTYIEENEVEQELECFYIFGRITFTVKEQAVVEVCDL